VTNTPTETPTNTPTQTNTPTNTVTPTVTPTSPPELPIYTGETVCDIPYNINTGITGSWQITVQLGSYTGTVACTFNAYQVPDKFQVFWDGNLVIDTGFRGNAIFNSQLNALGYPSVVGTGFVTASWTKLTAFPDFATVVVTAPIDSTRFYFKLGCPAVTPTPTVTPTHTPAPTNTPTNTPTPTPLPIIPLCSVLINGGTDVSAYFPSSNTNVLLGNSFTFSPDIAHTTTKLWLYDGTILEYDITLSPWSATFNRTIEYPLGVNLGNGLGSITNTELISTDDTVTPNQIIVLDITTSTAVSTVIGTLGVGRYVSGDILLTTTNKILVTNEGNDGVFLSQYSYPSGTFEVEVDITSTTSQPYGLFIDSGNIYVCNSGGEIYNVDVNFPYTQTLSNISGLFVGGASQVPSCCDTNLNLPPTPTPTNTPTPTPIA
jgi:hypothetical protein